MNNINRVSGETVSNLNTDHKTGKISNKERRAEGVQAASAVNIRQDVVSISSQAMAASGKASDLSRYSQIINNIPDVNQAKVDEVSRKVKDGVYFNRESADLTARKILEAMQRIGE